jgi:hypothetical protein
MARYGEAYDCRAMARTGAAEAGFRPCLRRRRARVGLKRVSGGVVVALRCSTRQERGQGVHMLVGWRVASGRPWAYLCDVSGMVWPSWARAFRRLSASSSTGGDARWCRVVWWSSETWWPGLRGRRREGARRGGTMAGMVCACMLCMLP